MRNLRWSGLDAILRVPRSVINRTNATTNPGPSHGMSSALSASPDTFDNLAASAKYPGAAAGGIRQLRRRRNAKDPRKCTARSYCHRHAATWPRCPWSLIPQPVQMPMFHVEHFASKPRCSTWNNSRAYDLNVPRGTFRHKSSRRCSELGIKNSSAPVSSISEPTSAAIHPPSRTRAAASSTVAAIFSTARMVTASNRRCAWHLFHAPWPNLCLQSEGSDDFAQKCHLFRLRLGDRHANSGQQHLDRQPRKSRSASVVQEFCACTQPAGEVSLQ